jgi:hypothetical protein
MEAFPAKKIVDHRNPGRTILFYSGGRTRKELQVMRKAVVVAGMGASLLAFSTLSASAEIACRGDVCWHVKEHSAFLPTDRVMIHPDNWKWGSNEHFAWREHEGHGYWEGDRWIAR